jgi:hypothetical protein
MDMRKEKYYTLRVTYLHSNGNEQVCMYGMNRKEFDALYKKQIEPKGTKVLNIEDVKVSMRYYS